MRRLWAVGDSLTYGVGWPADTPGGWRAPVADAVGPQVTWVGGSTENAAPGRLADRHDGHPGWRVDELAALEPVPADLVIAQAGTNDLIQRWAPERPHTGTYDEFNADQRALFAADVAARLDTWWRRLAQDAPLIGWTVPPAGLGGPLYSSPSLIALNALLSAEVVPGLVAAGHDVTLVDMHLALAPDGTVTRGLLGSDNVHPTPDGYRSMARVLTPVVRHALKAISR